MQPETAPTRGFHIISFETKFAAAPLFVNEHFDEGPKASIFIGPNGSGKSRILASIVDELTNMWSIRGKLAWDVSQQRHLPLEFPSSPNPNGSGIKFARRSFDAKLSYWLDGSKWEVERSERELFVRRNGATVAVDSLQLPDKVLAIAHLPIDKFRFADRGESDFYQYLGLRQSTNMTSTGSIETSALMHFIAAVRKAATSSLEKYWFPHLGLELPVFAEIGIEPKALVSTSNFEEYTDIAMRHIARRRGPASIAMEEHREEIVRDLESIWPFFNQLRDGHPNGLRKGRGRISFLFELLPALSSIADDIDNFTKILETGRKLRIFGNFRLCFHKHGRLFGFGELSSGEQHILSTVTALVANLGTTSAVFIDEPEVSLHPAWQAQYVPSLLSTLKSNPSTHVVIATHSHFLVSDLHPLLGSLTVAGGPAEGGYEAYNGDVFGRSPDNILYRVFGIGTAGNRYVEQDLTVALQMISGRKETDLSELRNIYDRLVPIAAPDNLALAEILKSIGVFLDKGGNA